MAILDPGGHEIVRHGTSKFLGELSLLSGQAVVPDGGRDRAPAVHRRRSRRAPRTALRGRAPQRSTPLDLHRPARGAANGAGRGTWDRRPALVGGHDADARLPSHGIASRSHGTKTEGGGWIRGVCPSLRLPGGADLLAPSTGQVSRPSGSVASSGRARKSTCSSSGLVGPGWAPRFTGPPRGSTRS